MIPADAELTPRDDAFPAWDDVPDKLKTYYARQMCVFSGPFVISKDLVIELDGREILLGAAMAADFDGTRSPRSGITSTTPP